GRGERLLRAGQDDLRRQGRRAVAGREGPCSRPSHTSRPQFWFRLTRSDTSRRVEIPASRGSPPLRARTKRTSSLCLDGAGRPAWRLNVGVTLPAASVGPSAGIDSWL